MEMEKNKLKSKWKPGLYGSLRALGNPEQSPEP